ncbi:MAG: hypothetical protein EP298_05700 [Gammaproteobacteria bacterium]|nr:MAG: hypothetical protein EP298_05700 [Gammaproteobacteria bacterium]UTW42769.1 hypothetical protein KFE69_01065 [bacterium SCSIO 12844]
MPLPFYKKPYLFLFSFYLGLQIIICYVYGGWLIVNIHDLDGYVGSAKVFFITTDISILFSGLVSLASLAVLQLRLAAKILLFINMVIYIAMMIYDFINPPPSISELLLYMSSSFIVILAYVVYEVLIQRIYVNEDNE